MLIIMRMETRLRGQQGNQIIKSFNWILAVEKPIKHDVFP
jgi:hypothetical protein